MNKIPSKTTDVYWIYALNKEYITDEESLFYKNTGNIGKWLIFVPSKELDTTWNKIKIATEQGMLGIASKTCTARQNPNARDIDTKVICVYTLNWKDKQDVMRVRDELRRLGYTQKLSYKSDEDTRLGKYTKDGDRSIAKYYE